MRFIIAVFRSRNETLYFANLLKQHGVFTSIINTPKEAGQACGISVKFSENVYPIAKRMLHSNPFRSFYGFFRVENMPYGRNVIEKLIV